MANIVLNLTEEGEKRCFCASELSSLADLGTVRRFVPGRSSESEWGETLEHCDVMLTGTGSRPLQDTDTRKYPATLFVSHAGGSVRGIIPRTLICQGVRVSHAASAMAASVAQFAVGLIILGLRDSFNRSQAVQRGAAFEVVRHKNWDRWVSRSLHDLTVGLVGLSQTGRRMPELLKPFGCRVVAYDPFWSERAAASIGVRLVTDLDDLLRETDVVSLHAPLLATTNNMLDARRVALMRNGTLIVNTARAQLYDQEALLARCELGELKLYTDVTAPEPLPVDHPAWKNPGVFISPHLAGPTEQALQGMGHHAIAEVRRYLNGEPLLEEVTAEMYDSLA